MLNPLSMFCCGCTIRFGVGVILICHLAVCCFYVASACSNLIFHNPFFSSSWSPQAQLFYTAFSLVGIPTVLIALWGTVMRVEVNIRIYLFYLACSFLIDLIALVYLCLLEDPCNTVSSIVSAMTNESKSTPWGGQAFVCGAFRILSYFFVSAVVCVEVYCLFVVWSLCEDVHSGRNGPELHELVPGKDDIILKHKRQDGPYADIVGFSHSRVPGPYPSAYGTISTGMPGQPTIFGGTEHETEYPPRQDAYY
mmetsp:Transcript_76464/g.177455  ORF Transcript_76464/g.177455 Transcript_76464/m.177455 type:complete len:252 (+) Transcript_76464:110-865(+)|eukprot:CAMPEP_0171102094 /NCGR_PEP_ID=MMETSP0766_2-20121228/56799_1 /TAXON_ID=439317 /ORGANISM="Gambierdiscus australes, Strain CAWD 149" /LENGTH=251 /DNA_ID=CAMNT_0011562303 /DNA_START=110 /DNA_END=865 /DNA_ORIENTATION=-